MDFLLKDLEIPVLGVIESMASTGRYTVEELAAAYEELLKKAVALRINATCGEDWFKELWPQ